MGDVGLGAPFAAAGVLMLGALVIFLSCRRLLVAPGAPAPAIPRAGAVDRG
jgi:hypothetical protein